ncbi:MAG: hypothetical protein L3K10_04000 [Thermoplasmata archaeon]|nr:hypothetical protein [Thermoplasmata archaeon]
MSANPEEIAGPGLRRPTDLSRRGMLALRLGLGVLWSFNLVYIFDPANQYWSTFRSTAQAYGGLTLGGNGFAVFVAAHSTFFALAIAGVTLYLALAFLLGLSTRAACLIGGAFNLALFVTQWAQITTLPGATDVGAQPLYLAMYAALFLGYEAPRLSLDSLLSRTLARRSTRRPGARPMRSGAVQPSSRTL